MTAGSMEGSSERRLPLWKRVLPFVVSIALLVVVFWRIDLRATSASLARANVGGFVAFTLVFLAALLSADVFGTLVVYRPVIGRIRFVDLLIVRGASYLPSLLNHHVGQAFVTVFLSRSRGVSLARVFGGTIVIYASWAACLLGLVMAAVVVSGSPAEWLILPLGAGVLYLLLIGLRPKVAQHVAALKPLFEAGIKGHLVAALARLPHALVLFFGTWLSFRFFEVEIPVGAALAYVPILMVAVTLPITPQGFGTRDLVATTLFAKFALGNSAGEREARVAAATLSFGVVLTILEAFLGLVLIRRATRLIAHGIAEHERP